MSFKHQFLLLIILGGIVSGLRRSWYVLIDGTYFLKSKAIQKNRHPKIINFESRQQAYQYMTDYFNNNPTRLLWGFVTYVHDDYCIFETKISNAHLKEPVSCRAYHTKGQIEEGDLVVCSVMPGYLITVLATLEPVFDTHKQAWLVKNHFNQQQPGFIKKKFKLSNKQYMPINL